MIAAHLVPFQIPAQFRKEQPVAVPVAEEPVHFCDDTHMDDLCEIIERGETVYTVFASIVEHATSWPQ